MNIDHKFDNCHSAQRPNIERDLNWQRLTDNNLLTMKVKVVMVLQLQVKLLIYYISFKKKTLKIVSRSSVVLD